MSAAELIAHIQGLYQSVRDEDRENRLRYLGDRTMEGRGHRRAYHARMGALDEQIRLARLELDRLLMGGPA